MMINSSTPTLRRLAGRNKQSAMWFKYVDPEEAEGEHFEVQASGLLATCVQHEIDHIDGLLFLDRLDIPVVSVLRDSQNYLHCVEGGVGLSELEGRNVRLDRKGWGELTNWLAVRCGLDGPPLTAIEGRRAAPSALDSAGPGSWGGRRDLNPRHPGPQPGALPN